MKMTRDHYEALKKKVEPLTQKIITHRESLRGDPKVQNLDTRTLWDTFHATRISNEYTYQEFDYLDTHIETAMRSIFRELGIPLDSDKCKLKEKS